jgi:hypothetical protein
VETLEILKLQQVNEDDFDLQKNCRQSLDSNPTK